MTSSFLLCVTFFAARSTNSQWFRSNWIMFYREAVLRFSLMSSCWSTSTLCDLVFPDRSLVLNSALPADSAQSSAEDLWCSPAIRGAGNGGPGLDWATEPDLSASIWTIWQVNEGEEWLNEQETRVKDDLCFSTESRRYNLGKWLLPYWAFIQVQ